MQTNSFSSKISGMASKIIEKIMLGLGVVALVWILAFLLVAIIDKWSDRLQSLASFSEFWNYIWMHSGPRTRSRQQTNCKHNHWGPLPPSLFYSFWWKPAGCTPSKTIQIFLCLIIQKRIQRDPNLSWKPVFVSPKTGFSLCKRCAAQHICHLNSTQSWNPFR